VPPAATAPQRGVVTSSHRFHSRIGPGLQFSSFEWNDRTASLQGLRDPVEIVLRQREPVRIDQALANERERAPAQILGRRLALELREQLARVRHAPRGPCAREQAWIQRAFSARRGSFDTRLSESGTEPGSSDSDWLSAQNAVVECMRQRRAVAASVANANSRAVATTAALMSNAVPPPPGDRLPRSESRDHRRRSTRRCRNHDARAFLQAPLSPSSA